jgi:hypothetical protein
MRLYLAEYLGLVLQMAEIENRMRIADEEEGKPGVNSFESTDRRCTNEGDEP